MEQLLHKGQLYNRRKNKLERYHVRKLSSKDIELIAAFQHACLTAKEKSDYCPLSALEIHYLLAEGGGYVLGAYAAGNHAEPDKLIALKALAFPRRKENLGINAGLARSEWDQVLHLEGTLIHPDYRGNGLQIELTRLGLSRHPHYRYRCATVSPYNMYSLNNLLALNFFVVNITIKYSGQNRLICFQDLQSIWKPDLSNAISVSLDDRKQIDQLFIKGYRGYQLLQSKGQRWLVFSR